jgi:hypothetical protein
MAVDIISNFVHPSSYLQVNLPEWISQRLLDDMMSIDRGEATTVVQDMFDDPYANIFRMVNLDSFRRFRLE